MIAIAAFILVASIYLLMYVLTDKLIGGRGQTRHAIDRQEIDEEIIGEVRIDEEIVGEVRSGSPDRRDAVNLRVLHIYAYKEDISIKGKAGETLDLVHRTSATVKIDKLIASDTFGGTATEITGVLIGHAQQMTGYTIATAVFLRGLDVTWDTATAGTDIKISVRFKEDAQFDATLIGDSLQ